MDPRSVTAQPEDSLTIYAVAGSPKQRCHCPNNARVADPPFRKVYKVDFIWDISSLRSLLIDHYPPHTYIHPAKKTHI